MITTRKQCEDAATALEKGTVSDAGSEWHAGCIIHNGGVYFSPYDSSASHDQAVNGGYLCHAFKSHSQCTDGQGMITTADICKDAAEDAGYEYKGTAGPEWPQGCFFHNGGIYYSNHPGDDSRNNGIVGPYLCNPKSTV
jgi:hypothetical protein